MIFGNWVFWLFICWVLFLLVATTVFLVLEFKKIIRLQLSMWLMRHVRKTKPVLTLYQSPNGKLKVYWHQPEKEEIRYTTR